MSRHTGSPPPCGTATRPAGAKAMPTGPARAAWRVSRPIAPQCELSVTPTAPMPCSRAGANASRLARMEPRRMHAR
jgi:hypothetical protein